MAYFWYAIIDTDITEYSHVLAGPMPALYWAVTRGPAAMPYISFDDDDDE
jgi:hypothetical protein